jgi:peptidoglycan/xylan/chitin deacetylase (PgdA/CDA1 family)
VQEQQKSVTTSKEDLERLIGTRVTHFAYPFGRNDNFDENSVEAVRLAGFDTACTTIPGTARPATDPLRLPRRVATNCGRLRFKAQLQRWRLG